MNASFTSQNGWLVNSNGLVQIAPGTTVPPNSAALPLHSNAVPMARFVSPTYENIPSNGVVSQAEPNTAGITGINPQVLSDSSVSDASWQGSNDGAANVIASPSSAMESVQQDGHNFISPVGGDSSGSSVVTHASSDIRRTDSPLPQHENKDSASTAPLDSSSVVTRRDSVDDNGGATQNDQAATVASNRSTAAIQNTPTVSLGGLPSLP